MIINKKMKEKMSFIKKQNNYILIFTMLFNVSCVSGIPLNLSNSSNKNESSEIHNDERKQNDQNCDLIWNIRYEDRREIFFQNTCTNRSCMVIWQSVNFLGVWSPFHYDYISPKGELSYPVSIYDVHFEVNYHFQ